MGRVRRRSLFVAAVLLTAAVVVVLANQPHDAPGRGTAAAAPRDTASASATAAPNGAGAASGLRVLHASYRFDDTSDAHPGAPDVAAASGVLLDVDDQTILWERSPHASLPPASTTKILSSLVALENLAPDRVVDVTPDALTAAADETKLGILAGDHYTVTELLQAMLTISANDAADVLAADTVGMQRFVAAMNDQVAALGLHDSHFTSPVGLDDPGQRSSAYDLAVAGLAAYDASELFRSIVGRVAIDVPATTGHVQYTLHNLNRLLQIYPPALGIKPGWTGDAGYCMVATAERDGHRLVLALMNAPRLYEDARAMLEWGFGQLGVPPFATPTPVPTPRR
ncbi:MAG TPA: serine hydrolase [Candidatus Dormibacteraeota bacterium]|nr:serine hydrolase [Candidatus Dormibacteraeota bacterium]